MKSFEKLNIARTITGKGKTAIIYKFKKCGTERIFFAPEIDGNRINSTMYARLYDAESVSRRYILQ